MKRSRFFLLPSALALLAIAAPAASAADALADVSARAVADFNQKLQTATQELTATRERIALEKKPLLDEARVAEERIIALGTQIADLESARAQANEKRQHLQHESFALLKNVGYLNTLARDSLKSAADSLLPGEAGEYAEPLDSLLRRFEDPAQTADLTAAMQAADLLLARTQRELGGYTASGQSLIGDDNRMVKGDFIFLGPEVFFRSDDGRYAGTVRTREGSTYPVAFPLPDASAEKLGAIVHGQMGAILADASGGKALRLRESTGTLFQHVDRGGPIAYLIIAVGLFALGLAGQKFFELRKLQVDAPAIVEPALRSVLRADAQEAQRLLARLKPATRELFQTGLRHLGKGRDVLEEHLFALTTRQRLHFERRLPLLAVIATASPLMGLLGTVMGMIKTFALITVFGTGNAAKLSSGISEVLVTTELGLIVAVPALVLHGVLSHRTQKRLSLLERYAVEFVAEAGDVASGAAEQETQPV